MEVACIENKDIGLVRKGMAAEIKIYSSPFKKYGLIYRMRLLMKRNTLWVDNRKVKLMPGMAVTAEAKTGTRKVIEFFLASLLQHGYGSLR